MKTYVDENMLLEELKLEAEYNLTATEKMKAYIDKMIESERSSNTQVGRAMTSYLYSTFSNNIKIFLEEMEKPKRGVRPSYYPITRYLLNLYENKQRDLIALLTLSTLHAVLNNTLTSGKPYSKHLSYVSKKAGVNVLNEAYIEDFMKTHDKEIQSKMINGLHLRKSDYYRRYYAVYLMNQYDFHPYSYSTKDIILFGGKLIDILLSSTDLFEYQVTTDKAGVTLTDVLPTEKCLQVWKQNTEMLMKKEHSNCPMIIEPDPWTSFYSGGYYGDLRPYSFLLRLKQVKGKEAREWTKKYLSKLEQVNLDPILEAINAIQSTPWRIDTKVLEVAKKIVELGGDRAGIPKMEPYEALPRLNNPTQEELKAHKKKAIAIYRKEASRKGRAIRVIGNLKTAERFKNYDKIWFPCNMDFRGRVYPIPSFSFQGDDLNKGLIQFADVPPIENEDDIKWFLIAGAEFAGIDKVSFDDCIKWVENNHENICGTFRDPLGSVDWWGNLDCPFEFLQFCFEYERLMNYKANHNNSVIGFKTGMPIAFDGTCSGIQHYSAMLRDPIGAKAVNLVPSDKPSDIYGMVAEVVNKYLDKDAISGTIDEWSEEKGRTLIGTKTMAQLWKQFGVNRKVTKRSVMTLAYGSKEYGFKYQVLEDTINNHLGEGVFTEENAYPMAAYMAKLIWQGVHEVVTKAVEGMEWLQKVARLICQNENIVSWTTPMGLPIQQSYFETKVETFRMRLSKTERRFYVASETGEIAGRKQAQGIAPNFIHSMDASHLQYSVVTAHRKGINHFAMIHDSYGTTCARAGLLFKTVRECFVSMYESHDILKEFAEEVKDYLPNIELPELPEKGNFNIKEVLNSTYAFH